jgi:TRAP-type mannitol/chloroaromatic compound transport system permease small subunit
MSETGILLLLAVVLVAVAALGSWMLRDRSPWWIQVAWISVLVLCLLGASYAVWILLEAAGPQSAP